MRQTIANLSRRKTKRLSRRPMDRDSKRAVEYLAYLKRREPQVGTMKGQG